MQSIIIIGKDREKIKKEATKVIMDNKISRFDVEILESEKAVGIETIRQLQKRIILKPIKSEKKAVILETFFGITTQSQNAFLKVLEEPPINTIIIILSTSLSFFLPTVLSRCTVLNIENIKKLTQEQISENLKILSLLMEAKISYALKLAQDNGKTKEEALNFLENLIIVADNNLGEKKEFGGFLKKMQVTYTTIKSTNVTPRFALENLLLNLNSK